ncbi:MAG TPA: flagellar hook-length control protein FliK [Armatimonadota bacterium]|nr:flagellar hook-length control protein FliK [Armatimonadota bacterium]
MNDIEQAANLIDVAMLGTQPIVGSPPGQAAQVEDPSCSFEAVIAQLIGQTNQGTESRVDEGSERAGRQETEKTPDPSGEASQAVGTAIAEAVILPRFVENAQTEHAGKTASDTKIGSEGVNLEYSESAASAMPSTAVTQNPPETELPADDRPPSDTPQGITPKAVSLPKSDHSDKVDVSDKSDVTRTPIPAPQRAQEAAQIEVPVQPPADQLTAKEIQPQPALVQTHKTPVSEPAASTVIAEPLIIMAENQPVAVQEDQPSIEAPKIGTQRTVIAPEPEAPVDRQPVSRPQFEAAVPDQQVEVEQAKVMDVQPISKLDEGKTDQPAKAEPKLGWAPIQAQDPSPQAVRLDGQTSAHLPPQEVTQAKVVHQIVRTIRMHTFDGGGSMVLKLAPPHLGTIRMDVTAEHGVVTANLSTSNESVRQILESGLSTLSRSLADAGVHVDAISVQTDTRPDVRDNLSQSLNWQGSSSHAGSRQGEQQYPRMLQMQMEQASETDSRRRGQFDFLA